MLTDRRLKKNTPIVIGLPVRPNSVVKWFRISVDISVTTSASAFNAYTFEKPAFRIESY